MPRQLDVVVVGGGALGLAVARRLALDGRRVVVLEKEPELARHQTGRNSGVIHSGVYYAPGSLKARLCAAGKESLLRYADERGIPHELAVLRCGHYSTGKAPFKFVDGWVLTRFLKRALS